MEHQTRRFNYAVLKYLKYLALGLLILIGMSWLIRVIFIDWYEYFIARELEVRPLFAALNEDVLEQVPAPQGVDEIERYLHLGGGSGYHGNFLTVVYAIRDASPQTVLSHYDQFFLSNGWSKYDGVYGVYSTDRFLYYRNTSCFVISIISEDEYRVYIEHDFFRQDFSPPVPPIWLIQLNEFGETYFARCPPQPGLP